ncbi:LysR family transcriptional regulator [Cupriavidus pauculus]|uniref:LysR family transcriptional regulator n=1 Tax=Cupriavidus pauculus TaxID=82633 RepID=A0A2N5CB76_9BURK|nr:LysR family transcriptional regulator [Cupriavidus pauculus]PLP99477.1 LysR family transcriptional regulator [Cupriavidus pauculus]
MNTSQFSQRRAGTAAANSTDAFSTCFAASYGGIIAFMAVATEGSFAKGAVRLGVGRSAVCRSIQKLESQLSTRLFLRTTRATQLTREGERFFENCSRGVGHIADALNDMQDLRDGPPRGLLRISSTVDFGRKVVAPLLAKFSEAYPEISFDVLLDDRPADFVADQIDVAFRNGRIEDSTIIAKQLLPMRTVLCASREYMQRRGLPATVEELGQHDCINYRRLGGPALEWEFKINGKMQRYLPGARLTFSDSELVLEAVLAGRGIGQLAGYQIGEYVTRGELVTVMDRHAPDDRGHYICYLCRQHLPQRIRVLVDFMTEQIRALDLNPWSPLNPEPTGDQPEKLAA